MKNIIYTIAFLFVLSVTSCKKNENVKETETSYRYVAEDGNSATVTFKNSSEGNSISIKSNNKTISAPQKDSDGKVTVFEKDGIEIKSANDSVIITQGDNVIGLKKARGQ